MSSISPKRFTIYFILTLVVILLVTEVAVRIYFHFAGYIVGSLAPNWQPIINADSLIVEDAFLADSSGLFIANPEYWAERNVQVNSDGFRGPEFVADTTSTKPSLLLIGDSFTWGAEAQPLDSCFADRLRQKYKVYNTGIPGADPAQYALIAQQYITKLKPDYVAVMFYTGNDVMAMQRVPKAYKNLYFVTNKGWLPGWYRGEYFRSAKKSNDFYIRMYTPRSTFAKMACKTALGTLVMSVPLRMKEREQKTKSIERDVSYQYLFQVFWICQQVGVKPLIFVIPNGAEDVNDAFNKDPRVLLSNYPATFKNLQNITHVIPASKGDYLPMPNGHFNNQGHAKAAAYIDSVISAYP